MGFDFEYFLSTFPLLIPYSKNTIAIALLAFILSIGIALILAISVQYKIKILYPLSKAYVSFFRCTPILSQLFFFYFGLAQLSLVIKNMNAFIAIVIVMSMNEAAFMSETIRGAFNSIDKGQYEACISIGMTNGQTMRRVILPQAIRVAIPGLSNSFISLMKGSSIGFTIGVIELMSVAKMESARSYRMMEIYMSILVIYWVIIGIFTFFQNKIEKRVNEGY